MELLTDNFLFSRILKNSSKKSSTAAQKLQKETFYLYFQKSTFNEDMPRDENEKSFIFNFSFQNTS